MNGPVEPMDGPVEPMNEPVEPMNGPVEPINGPSTVSFFRGHGDAAVEAASVDWTMAASPCPRLQQSPFYKRDSQTLPNPSKPF